MGLVCYQLQVLLSLLENQLTGRENTYRVHTAAGCDIAIPFFFPFVRGERREGGRVEGCGKLEGPSNWPDFKIVMGCFCSQGYFFQQATSLQWRCCSALSVFTTSNNRVVGLNDGMKML